MLPVDFRNRLGLRPGDEVRITEESDGSLRIESRRTAAHALIGLAGAVEHSVLDDLAADRRDQAAADDADVARSSGMPSVSPDTVGSR
jgi:bifunctional DNA-binding transcriptional regulator/antitoxin component of YhaV-PrlF toxin-antitoxin module